MNTKIDTHIVSNSSLVLRVDYDNLMNSMKVFFIGGGVYTFLEVPKTVFENFKQAESAGKFFHGNVKNKFEFQRNV